MKFLDDIYYKNARLLSVDVVRRFDRKPQLMMGVLWQAYYAAVCGLSLKEMNKLEVPGHGNVALEDSS